MRSRAERSGPCKKHSGKALSTLTHTTANILSPMQLRQTNTRKRWGEGVVVGVTVISHEWELSFPF